MWVHFIFAQAKNILIIHSFHETLPWTKNVAHGIQNILDLSDVEIEVYSEYLDINRCNKRQSFNTFQTYIRNKYKDHNIDIVLVSDNAALEFWQNHKSPEFESKPIVFCGINNFSKQLIQNRAITTGVSENIDVQKTIEFVKTIHPKTSKFLIINDQSETGKILNEVLMNIIPTISDGITFELEHNLSKQHLRKKLSSLPKNTAVLLFSFYIDHLNDWESTEQFVQQLTTISKAPIFTFWNNVFAHGTAGGVVVSGEQHGEISARYALRILNGTSPQDLPIVKSPNIQLLDESSIHRFGFRNIPNSTIIANQRVSIFNEYRTYIIVFFTAFTLLVILTLYLLINVFYRKKAEEQLIENEKKFRSAYSDSNIGMAMIDIHGHFLEVNIAFQNILGYKLNEIMNKNFTEIVHLETNQIQNELELLTKSSVHTFEKKFIRKDGSICISLATISPILNEDKTVDYSILHLQDITQRVLTKINLVESTKRFAQLFHKSPAATWELDLNNALIYIRNVYSEHQENFKSYLDQNRDVLRTCVEKMSVLDVNEAALKMFELSAKVVFYEHFCKIIDTEFGNFVLNAIIRVLNGEDGFHGEARVKTFQGDYLDVLAYVSLLREGNDMKALVTMLDITERNRAISELKKSEERFGLAMNASKDGLWDYNLEEESVYYSPNLLLMLEVHNEYEIPDCFVINHTREENRLEIQEILHSAIQSKQKNLELEIELKTVSGNFIPVLTRTNLIYDKLGNLVRMVGTIIDLSDHYQISEAYRKEKERAQLYLNVVEVIVMVLDSNGSVSMMNPKGCEITGYNPDEIIGKNWLETCILEEDRARLLHVLEKIKSNEISLKNKHFENKIICKDGHIEIIRWRLSLIKNKDGETYDMLCSGENITSQIQQANHQKNLEQQLTQAQKMESIGRLAGGVAHDFNNMLSVILGYSDMVLSQLGKESEIYDDIIEIQDAANRSAELTKQLLAFARKQAIIPKNILLNDAIESMLKMLRRVIGENIELMWQPSNQALCVWMDSSQLNQILANLCVNARDAIENDGVITISTKLEEITEIQAQNNPNYKKGTYALLTFCDNGSGMNNETLVKIFEPFFTTKEEGKGTGLGLAMIYGIIQQNHGFIDVKSELGKGTSFYLYLPISDHIDKQSNQDKKTITKGSEKVLIVEDNPTVLNVTSKILTKYGYEVYKANSPHNALEQMEEHQGQFDIVLSDVIMPEMNGRELIKILNKKYPTVKMLLMSGYTADILDEKAGLNLQFDILKKPFTPKELIDKIQTKLQN
jgi:PAS domain S-box-containing protein